MRWPQALVDRTLLVALAAEAAATLADILLGPYGQIGTEEAYNARAGLMLACGHLDSIWALQYRPFCGGCTANALLSAPLFGLFGNLAAAWKLVPAGLHLVAVASAAILCRRIAGTGAGVLLVATMAAMPDFYRELSLTGWGNHAESAAFTFGAAALLLGERRPTLQASLAGLLAGLGLWYCYTSAHALPALFLLALWRGRGPSFALALLPGASPWWLYHRSRPADLHAARDWAQQVDLAPPAELWRWVAGDLLHGTLWQGEGIVPTLSPVWWLGFAGLGLSGAALAWRRGGPGRFALLGLLGLLAAWWLRWDLWSDTPHIRGYDAFNLRYRAPLVPLLAVGLAVLPLLAPRAKRGLAIGIALLLAWGWMLRVRGWSGPLESPSREAYAVGTEPDPTVPSGEPPQRLARARGRAVDIAAAKTFAERHGDRLSVCSRAHRAEWARRAGVGLASAPPVVVDSLPVPTDGEGALLARVLAAGLIGRDLADLNERIKRISLLPPAWQGPTEAAAGAWVAEVGGCGGTPGLRGEALLAYTRSCAAE